MMVSATWGLTQLTYIVFSPKTNWNCSNLDSGNKAVNPDYRESYIHVNTCKTNMFTQIIECCYCDSSGVLQGVFPCIF